MQKKTRQENFDLILGKNAVQFNPRQLPTHEDIMRAWFWERIEKKNGVLEPSRHALCHAVSSKLVDIWSSYSIPTVSIKKIRDMVGETLNKHQKIRKNYNRDNGNPSFNKKT